MATEKPKMKLIQHVAEIMDAENVPKWTLTAHGIAPILSTDGNKDLKMESCVLTSRELAKELSANVISNW